jgi:hypothetical protein
MSKSIAFTITVSDGLVDDVTDGIKAVLRASDKPSTTEIITWLALGLMKHHGCPMFKNVDGVPVVKPPSAGFESVLDQLLSCNKSTSASANTDSPPSPSSRSDTAPPAATDSSLPKFSGSQLHNPDAMISLLNSINGFEGIASMIGNFMVQPSSTSPVSGVSDMTDESSTGDSNKYGVKYTE